MTKKVGLRNPVKIEAASKYSTVDTLKQMYSFMPAKHEDCYLVYMLIEMAASTCMSQSKRLGALNKFKSGDCNILICTDVARRGQDIPTVDMAINYDIPTKQIPRIISIVWEELHHTSIKVQRRPKLCSGLCSTSSSTPTGSSITRQKQQDISLQTFRLLGSGMSEHYTTDTKNVEHVLKG
ncbi:hypothetical protein K1719_017340 [Acacia pycnantha]|nr:hypothetical protein K1719_017340 [Acacia pycnantha]